MLLGQAGEKRSKQNGFTIKIKNHEHHWQINEGRTNQHLALTLPVSSTNVPLVSTLATFVEIQ